MAEIRESVVKELVEFLAQHEDGFDEMVMEFRDHPTDEERAEAERRYVDSVGDKVKDDMARLADD